MQNRGFQTGLPIKKSKQTGQLLIKPKWQLLEVPRPTCRANYSANMKPVSYKSKGRPERGGWSREAVVRLTLIAMTTSCWNSNGPLGAAVQL